MNKNKKNRSGSQSNESGKNERRGDVKRTKLPGAPARSNRQTGDHEKDNSKGAERNITKKGPNSI